MNSDIAVISSLGVIVIGAAIILVKLGIVQKSSNTA